MSLFKELAPVFLIAFVIIATVQGGGVGLYWFIKHEMPTTLTVAVLGLAGLTCAGLTVFLSRGYFIPLSGTQFRTVYTIQTEGDFRAHKDPYDVYCTKSAAQSEADAINRFDPTHSDNKLFVHAARVTIRIADGRIMSPKRFQNSICRP